MPECNGIIHKVNEGDTIVSIARRYGVKLADMIMANTHLHDPTRLKTGEEVCVPLGKNATEVIDYTGRILTEPACKCMPMGCGTLLG